MENFELRFEGKKLFLNNLEYAYKKGKFALFVPIEQRVAYKFFIFFNKALVPVDLNVVEKIFKIHEILFKEEISVNPFCLISCSVNGKTGFGIKTEMAIAKGNLRKNPYFEKWCLRLKKVCIKHGLRRQGTVANIIKEVRSYQKVNAIWTKTGIKLVDVDPPWTIIK